MNILTNRHSKTLVTTMVELGHQLGHRIIAEGVETEKQLEILKGLNCDASQGLFSKPICGKEMLKLLREK